MDKSGVTSLRFGIVGCGSAALPVCQAIANLSETSLAHVHDTNMVLACDLGERYGVPYSPDLDKLLATEIDAVYIAVPHYLLAPLAKRALEANKHVLVEKPMALTLEQADALIELAAAKQRTLGVFYELRYTPGFVQARDLVRGGALGEIIGVRLQTLIDKPLTYWQVGYTGRSVNTWRGETAQAGGGVTLMNSSHLLDGVWFVTGLNVTQVSAARGTLVAKVEVEDTLVATLRFENGALGSLFAGAHIVGALGAEGFDIYGTRGSLRVADPYGNGTLQVYLQEPYQLAAENAPHPQPLYPRERGNSLPDETIPANVWHTLAPTSVNMFERAIQDFAQAAQLNQRAPMAGEDARRVLQVVLAMYQAADEQRIVNLHNDQVMQVS